MAWNLSSGLTKDLRNKRIQVVTRVMASTLTFVHNKIQDSANGLGDFKVGDWVHTMNVNAGGNNDNIVARVIGVSSAELTFADNTFSSMASGTLMAVTTFLSGSFAEIMKNGRLDLYSGSLPTDADQSEGSSTLLASLTLNGGAFVSGVATNGINVDILSGASVQRAIDPATGAVEEWKATGLADGTAQWGRWHSNIVVAGASTVAKRMDALVTTQAGGDIVMANGRDIAIGAPVTVTDVNVSFVGV